MWLVLVGNRAKKGVKKLSKNALALFDLLLKEIEAAGPYRVNWSHYGKIKSGNAVELFHCHIQSGRPTLVVCWWVVNKETRTVEIYYVGSHENAPY